MVLLESMLRGQKRRRRWITVILLAALLVTVALNLGIGQFDTNWWQGWSSFSPVQQQIILQLRLPRLITALLVGGGLALCGYILQILLQNPVAEPGLIGVSSGSGLFAILLLFFSFRWQLSFSPWMLSVSAFAGAVLVTGVLLLLSIRGRFRGARLLLLGMAIGITCNALTTWLIYFSNDQGLRQMISWLMGSLATMPVSLSWWIVVYLGGCVWLMGQARSLQLLQLGRIQAQLVGVNIRQLQIRLLLALCLIIGMSVALTGLIGFVGLVVPHFVRLCSSDRVSFNLPVSFFGGGILLAMADLLARTVLSGGELPVGVVTATMGAPVFILLLVRRYAFS